FHYEFSASFGCFTVSTRCVWFCSRKRDRGARTFCVALNVPVLFFPDFVKQREPHACMRTAENRNRGVSFIRVGTKTTIRPIEIRFPCGDKTLRVCLV